LEYSTENRSESRIIVITGANQGIGFELTKQLAQEGHTVFLGSRSLKNGHDAVATLDKNIANNIHVVQLDITDQASVDAAVKTVQAKYKHIDVLVNNAGVSFDKGTTASNVSTEVFKNTFETNVFGVVRVTTAFVPLLKLSKNPVVLNVSSAIGSITLIADPTTIISQFGYTAAAYDASKAALNMYTATLSIDFKEARVNSISPGYVSTNINKHAKEATVKIEDSAKGIIKNGILLEKDGPTGQFLDFADTKWPW